MKDRDELFVDDEKSVAVLVKIPPPIFKHIEKKRLVLGYTTQQMLLEAYRRAFMEPELKQNDTL